MVIVVNVDNDKRITQRGWRVRVPRLGINVCINAPVGEDAECAVGQRLH